MHSGELAALGTATCWSFTGLFFAEAARRVGALRVNLLRLPVALVLLSLTVAATGVSLATLDGTLVAWLTASGVVGLVVGDLALFEAMRRIGPRLALLIMSLAPISASVAGLLMLNERPGRLALLGIAVTLAFNLPDRTHHGGVITVAKRSPELGVAALQALAAEVDRDVARVRDAPVAILAEHVARAKVEVVADRLDHVVDARRAGARRQRRREHEGHDPQRHPATHSPPPRGTPP
jgi:hypothetical protein